MDVWISPSRFKVVAPVKPFFCFLEFHFKDLSGHSISFPGLTFDQKNKKMEIRLFYLTSLTV